MSTLNSFTIPKVSYQHSIKERIVVCMLIPNSFLINNPEGIILKIFVLIGTTFLLGVIFKVIFTLIKNTLHEVIKNTSIEIKFQYGTSGYLWNLFCESKRLYWQTSSDFISIHTPPPLGYYCPTQLKYLHNADKWEAKKYIIEE